MRTYEQLSVLPHQLAKYTVLMKKSPIRDSSTSKISIFWGISFWVILYRVLSLIECNFAEVCFHQWNVNRFYSWVTRFDTLQYENPLKCIQSRPELHQSLAIFVVSFRTVCRTILKNRQTESQNSPTKSSRKSKMAWHGVSDVEKAQDVLLTAEVHEFTSSYST